MTNAFSFADEEQSAIISCYQDAVEEMDYLTDRFIDGLTEICVRTQYMPFVSFANKCILFENEDLRGQVISNFQEWRESDSSLSAFITTMSGGDDAFETAQRLENQLEEVFSELFRTKEQLTIDTAMPDIGISDYEQLVELTNEYRESLTVLRSNVLKIIDDRAEENAAYRCISGVVEGTTAGVLTATEEFRVQVENMQDLFEERSQAHVDASETIASELSIKAEEFARERFQEAIKAFGEEL